MQAAERADDVLAQLAHELEGCPESAPWHYRTLAWARECSCHWWVLVYFDRQFAVRPCETLPEEARSSALRLELIAVPDLVSRAEEGVIDGLHSRESVEIGEDARSFEAIGRALLQQAMYEYSFHTLSSHSPHLFSFCVVASSNS